MQSHPPCHRDVMDCFRRYAHARVITDFENMADCHEERTLKASEKAKTKTRMTATRPQENQGREARRNDYRSKHKTSLLLYCWH